MFLQGELSKVIPVIISQFGRYSIVGVLNTVVGHAVIFVCYYITNIALLSSVVGYLAGLAIMFFLAPKFVFGLRKGDIFVVFKFFVSFFVCLSINLVIVAVVKGKGYPFFLAQLSGSLVYLFIFFIFSKLWIYRQEGTR